MAALPRSLPRLLRKQAPAISPRTIIRTHTYTPIRAAQTETASAALNNNHNAPPPFQHNAHTQQKPQSATTQSQNQQHQDTLEKHPLLQSLRTNKILKEIRPHLSMPSHLASSHLVAGTLSGPTKLPSAPYMFLTKPIQSEEATFPRKTSSTTLFTIGPDMCGHPGYIHGGLLSILFDEIFAHTVSQSFKSGTGMTANLNVDFRKPALPNRHYVLRAETVKVEGRKAFVEGGMIMLPLEGDVVKQGEEGVLVAEARALFVEPRFAESMVSVYKN
ncbi:HotDog domain-containing protein [Aspergillus stella-maris]|uniref:HotDog domain-containing protein n=1 Tax=Aspergillus stella-maris TaxID=1810926 RepID=UPI003CCDD2C4